MATVANEISGVDTVEWVRVESRPTITTLYDLIATLQDRAEPWEEDVVTTAVVDLCNTGYLNFINVPKNCKVVCA